METTTATQTETTVAVEAAPLGIQLWPTISPEFADNFTLASVSIVRDEMDEANGRPEGHVVWTYRNGATRTFRVGEQITVKFC